MTPSRCCSRRSSVRGERSSSLVERVTALKIVFAPDGRLWPTQERMSRPRVEPGFRESLCSGARGAPGSSMGRNAKDNFFFSASPSRARRIPLPGSLVRAKPQEKSASVCHKNWQQISCTERIRILRALQKNPSNPNRSCPSSNREGGGLLTENGRPAGPHSAHAFADGGLRESRRSKIRGRPKLERLPSIVPENKIENRVEESRSIT